MVRDAPIGKAEAARTTADAVPAHTSGFPAPECADAVADLARHCNRWTNPPVKIVPSHLFE
jgi:hypothetical protein